MNSMLKALVQLQRVDLQIAAAQRELAALDPGAQLKATAALAEKKFVQAAEVLKTSEAELRDKELNLKTVETKKQNFEHKLYQGGVTNPKELSGIEKEIEMLGKTRSQLDDRVLELYEVVERQQAEKAHAEKVAMAYKQKLAQHITEFQAKSAELNAALTRLEAERQSAVAAVTERQILSRYESLRKRHKDTGLAKVTDGKCGGCHVGLTPFSIRKMYESADGDYPECENCGRILFQEE